MNPTAFPWECPQGVAIPRTAHSSPLLGPVHETAIFRPGQGSSNGPACGNELAGSVRSHIPLTSPALMLGSWLSFTGLL